MLRLILLLLLTGGYSLFAASTNDLFASRILLAGSDAFGNGVFTGAGVENGEPHGLGASLWWEWKAPRSGGFGVTATAPFSAPIASLVYTGTWPNLRLVSSPGAVFSSFGGTPLLEGFSSASFRAEEGLTYYIAAAGFTNQASGSVTVRLRPGPLNDDLDLATQLTGVVAGATVSLVGATSEPGEALLSTNSAGATVWWKWRPGSAGRYLVSTRDAGPVGITLGVYRGTSFGDLVLLGRSGTDFLIDRAQLIGDFADESYYVTVQDAAKRLGSVSLRVLAVPANDEFEQRFLLEGTNVVATENVAAATRELGEGGPLPNFGGSLWWEWIAPFSGGVALDVTSPTLGVLAAVYTGDTVTNLANVDGAFFSSKLGFRAREGERYFIAVYASVTDPGSLTLRLRPGPANDDFSKAQAIEGMVAVSGSLHGATLESSEAGATNTSGASVWYRWTPSVPGSYSVETRSSDAAVSLAAYRGTELTNLALLREEQNGNGREAARITVAAASEAIYLRVWNIGGGLTSFTLNVRPGPTNDFLENAVLVENQTVSGTTRGATAQPQEAALGVGDMPTVWHRWVPEHSGGFEMRVSGGAAGNLVKLFSGNTLANLKEVGAVSTFSSLAASGTVRVEGGREYYLLVAGRTGGGDSYLVTFTAADSNDDFEKRAVLTGSEPSGSGTLTGATLEPGESSQVGTRTVWWEWTAPGTSGIVLLVGSTSDEVNVAVYASGESVSNLVAVEVRHYDLLTVKRVAFRAEAGVRYLFQVGASSYAGPVTLSSQLAAPNDAFAKAEAIENLDEVHQASAMGASREPGEPLTWSGSGTLWYRWTVPTNGSFAAISGNGSRIAVYSGTALTDLVKVAENSSRSGISLGTLHAAMGETLFIALEANVVSEVSVYVKPGAANDDFANAAVISAPGVPVGIPFLYATTEPGEPERFFPVSNKSLWWRFVAPATSGYRIRIPAIVGSAWVAVYTGDIISRLTPVASRLDAFDLSLTFRAVAGTEYKIAFGGDYEGYGGYEMTIDPGPVNDDFGNATPVQLGISVTNVAAGATLQAGEMPFTSGEKGTVWYSWIAPTNGNYLLTAGPETWGPHLGVFKGSTLATLIPVAIGTTWVSPGRTLVFAAEAGVAYRIAVAVDAVESDQPLVVTVLPGHPNDNFGAPALLEGMFVAWTNTTSGATAEVGESFAPLAGDRASVWALWTAPANGEFRARASTVNPQVFTGTNFASLQRVDTGTEGQFRASAGMDYRIRLETATNGMADFVLRLGPVPPNDEVTNATELAGTNVVGASWTWNAARGPSEGRESIWWRWLAPSDGFLQASTSNSGSGVTFVAYHGRVPTLGDMVTSASTPFTDPKGAMTATSRFVVTRGMEYRFEVASLVPSTNVILSLALEPIEPLPEEWATMLPHTLRSGTGLWRYDAGTNALVAGPLLPRGDAWIEAIYPGPGMLRFWWKGSGRVGDSLAVYGDEGGLSRKILSPAPASWAEMKLALPRGTNLVRWTFNSFSLRGTPGGAAYLSNVVFTAIPARAVTFRSSFTGTNLVQLTFSPEAQRRYSIERSTNLVEWAEVTNFFTTTIGLRVLRYPIETNAQAAFYRALAE